MSTFFLLVLRIGGGDCRTRLAYSANGIQWNFYNRGAPVTGRAADFSNQIVWDPGRQKYLLLCREDFAAGGGLGELRGVRIITGHTDAVAGLTDTSTTNLLRATGPVASVFLWWRS